LDANIDVVWTREPGGTEFAEEIRKLILSPGHFEDVAAETELLLMFAARAQHLNKLILPALKEGRWVASDRFIDASYAYQGGGRGMDMKYITMLDQWIVNSTYPSLTLLLDIAPQQGFERAEKRGTQKDRIEQEAIEFFMRVREVYLQRAKQDPDRIKVIDASVPIFAVESQIRDALDAFVKRK
jgi:dTMP kinase